MTTNMVLKAQPKLWSAAIFLAPCLKATQGFPLFHTISLSWLKLSCVDWLLPHPSPYRDSLPGTVWLLTKVSQGWSYSLDTAMSCPNFQITMHFLTSIVQNNHLSQIFWLASTVLQNFLHSLSWCTKYYNRDFDKQEHQYKSNTSLHNNACKRDISFQTSKQLVVWEDTRQRIFWKFISMTFAFVLKALLLK